MDDLGRFVGQRAQRRAFGLIELLVAISIVGILVSLLAPGVQQARETARQMDCGNRIRQTALGCQIFHGTHRMIPTNGGPAPGNDLSLVGGPAVQPQTKDLSDGKVYHWGVGDHSQPPRLQTGSWAYAILPFVEMGALQSSRACDAAIPIITCPSRPRGDARPAIDDIHGRYISGGVAMTKTDFCGNRRLIPNRPESKSFSDVKHGLSNTILLGEKSHDPAVQTETSWYWDEPIWLGGSKGTARDGLQVIADGRGIPFRENWGSAHPAGAWFAFGDGRVQVITNSVDWQLMAASLSPDGRETNGVEP